MKQNGDAIYRCGYTGWEKQDWGYYTKNQEGNAVYMLVFNKPVSGKLKVKPGKEIQIEKAYFNTGKKAVLKLEKIDNGASYVVLPDNFHSDKPFVIVLDIKDEKN